MILGTAMALATFSIAAWAIADANRSRVARLTVGAPTVLSVVPPPGTRLGDVVDQVDPGGKAASAVFTFDNGSRTLVAVQPQRFAAVANWDGGIGGVGPLLSRLHPEAPPSIVLDGTQVRLQLRVDRLAPAGGEATIDVVAAGGTASTPVELGTIDRAGRDVTLTGSLSGCPCLLRDLQLSPPGGTAAQVRGDVTLTRLEVRGDGGWRPLDGALQPERWLDVQDQQVQVEASADGLRWAFFAVAGVPPTLTTHDRPAALPAVVAAPAAGNGGSVIFSGLDAHDVELAVLGRTSAVPGAPEDGAIVDLDFATRAAFGNTAPATAEVWVDGAADRIRQGLVDAGVAVIASRTSADLDAQISRQGPGLASVLFLADAAAAAVLAALAAVLSLSAAARRRRYEYAALGATGATPRTLFAALAIEQVVVVGFGAIVGIAAGLVSIAIAGPSVPEFVVLPAEELLRHSPPVLLLVGVLGAACVVLFAAAIAAAAMLLRSVSPEQLREAPT
jgi:hypothetical protein